MKGSLEFMKLNQWTVSVMLPLHPALKWTVWNLNFTFLMDESCVNVHSVFSFLRHVNLVHNIIFCCDSSKSMDFIKLQARKCDLLVLQMESELYFSRMFSVSINF